MWRRRLPIAGVLLLATALAQTVQPPGQGPVYKVGGGVSAPRATYTPDPIYPEQARQQRLEGTVVLWLIVAVDGTTRDVKVARTLGHGFDQAAIAAVKQWKFEPSRKDGQPVPVQINVEVNFRLGSPPQGAAPDTAAKNQSEVLAFLGVSLDLPSQWQLVSKVEPTYTRPAAMMFNLTGTPAYLALSRQFLESSPELFLKLMQSNLGAVIPDYQVTSREDIQRNGWSGVRFTGIGTKDRIPLRQIVEVFSRDNEHYVISVIAPDEVFPKHAAEFDKVLGSVDVKGIAAAPDASVPPKP